MREQRDEASGTALLEDVAAVEGIVGSNGDSVQVATRWLLPGHHSTAALDTALGRVRDFLDSRSFVLRNAARTNVLLGLVRNHLNGRDIESRYRTQLRALVDEREGHAEAQRAAYDPRIDPRFPGQMRRYPGSLRV